MSHTTDVLIAGAGIAGIATAYYLTKQHGITNITVVDPHAPLSQTTAKSGENYRNWWPFPPLAAFTNRSIDLLETLAAATNNRFQMQRRGYLYVSTQPEVEAFVGQIRQSYGWAADQIRTHHGYANSSYDPQLTDGYLGRPNGIDILTDRRLIRRWFPHLSEEITVAVHVRRAGALTVQLLGGYLWEEAKAAGARLVRGDVVAVQQDGAGITGVTVRTPGGEERIQSRVLVNAAGPFLPHVARLVGVDLPVHSVFQQKIAMIDPLGVLPRNAPFTIYLDSQQVAWHDEERAFWQSDPEYAWLLQPFPGGLHIRPEGSGDSTWIKLGWAINQQAEDPIWSPLG
ncbi:MAG: FAD-binding oxidoreductase, partial [Caldilineaceae bacterium]|nr:FAD-binding oxidoreductase [Caldilineaceae bacterium]